MHASYNDCLKSCERMFDIDSLNRDYKWLGSPLIRAFIPKLTRDMVRRYTVYKRGKRVA